MIYLDSAATSFLKPQSVKRAVWRSMNCLSSPGRGGYAAAMRSADVCWACREMAGEMFGCPPENVAFTFNATHGLNIAINTLVSEGDRVVISGYEHNAVTRALTARRADISVASGALFDDEMLLESFRVLLPGAKCCVCTHVSNVFGYVLPIDKIAQMCSENSVPLIVDASQSAGVLPVNMRKWQADFVAMPGHKGLMGPQGTGMLMCARQPEPVLFGGTGSASIMQTMPEELPDRLEAGTHNMPGIAGLLAGMDFVKNTGISNISAFECSLRKMLSGYLERRNCAEIFEGGESQSGVLSVRFHGIDCNDMAERLSHRGVAVRAGLHCAPLAHESVGTLDTGTVRFSFSPFNTQAEIMRTAKIIGDILNKT